MKHFKLTEELKKRIAEIKYQWECYKNDRRSLNAKALKLLEKDAKKYGVKLK